MRGRSSRRVVLSVVVALLLGSSPGWGEVASGGEGRPARGEITRLAGGDRIGTAVEISRATFAPRVPLAMIATADRFPDGLSAGPLAATIGAPILLTWRDDLPVETARELERLRPARILILGGPEAVSETVAFELTGYAPADSVDRIWGPTRYETAAEIALEAFTAPVGIAFIASGLDYPDALSGAAAGARLGGPILLTRANELPAAARTALEELAPARIVVLGGEEVVTEGVRQELAFYTGAPVERWSGSDRYRTSARIAAEAFPAPQTTAVFVATGERFPDALTGAAAAGIFDAPLLLTSRFQVPERLAEELERLAAGGLDVYVLGGEQVISTQVADLLSAYANPTLSKLEGEVTDAVSAERVAAADVQLWRGDAEEATTASGPAGAFAFESLVWGRFRLEVTRVGYAPGSVTDVEIAPGEHHEEEVALERVASIAGRVVVAGSDEQVPGADVSARRVVSGEMVGPTFEAETDSDGAFVISDDELQGLEPGQYRYEATHDDFTSTSTLVTVTSGEWTEVEIELVRAA